MTDTNGLRRFISLERDPLNCAVVSVRAVYISEVVRAPSDQLLLETFLLEKIPYFYRTLPNILDSFGEGFFFTAIRETLSRLPNADSFRESHFGEIAVSVFAEEVLGLKKLYSKLALLTAENANAYKMDLVLYDPAADPIELVWAEVKYSPKHASEGLPANHDQSCYPDIFNSLNNYNANDLHFDLGAAKDQIDSLPEAERQRVRRALQPYSGTRLNYAGFAIIDTSTRYDSEMKVLATRRNSKTFDIDVICVEDLREVTHALFNKIDTFLEAIKNVLN